MFKPSLEVLEDRTMPSFSGLPPEINSGVMGQAAAAWEGLAAELNSAATSYAAVISGLSGGKWSGPASATTANLATFCKFTVQADALAATAPPAVVTANRSQLISLVASNLFGQNTPAIAATEAQYMEMWAQDAASFAW